MALNAPTPAQLRDIAEDLGLSLTDEEVKFHIGAMADTIAAYRAIDALPDHLPEVKYPRGGGYRPGHHENRLNAWAWKASIKGKARGPLAGKTVVIKDNVCVAGLPMMNGSSTLEGYVPNVDATIVTRILDAGGEIASASACRAAAIPASLCRCTMRANMAGRPAGRPRAALRWWPPARSTWRSAATRAGRCASPRPIAGPAA